MKSVKGSLVLGLVSLVVILDTLLASSHAACCDRHDCAAQQRSIAQLISKINENPIEGHADNTPIVRVLIAIGRPALEPCLDAVASSEDRETRMRCVIVIDAIVRKLIQEELGINMEVLGGKVDIHNHQTGGMKVDFDFYQTVEGKLMEMHDDLWHKMGDLDYRSPSEERLASVRRWKAWLDQDRSTTEAKGSHSPHESHGNRNRH